MCIALLLEPDELIPTVTVMYVNTKPSVTLIAYKNLGIWNFLSIMASIINTAHVMATSKMPVVPLKPVAVADNKYSPINTLVSHLSYQTSTKISMTTIESDIAMPKAFALLNKWLSSQEKGSFTPTMLSGMMHTRHNNVPKQYTK